MSEQETPRRRTSSPVAPTSAGRERMALAAWIALAAVLHLRALGTGFVEADLAAIDTVLRTNLDALLRAGALPGDFAPLSRELYWWWWGRIVSLDAFAFHLLNAAIAVAGGWLLFRAAQRWGGVEAGLIAGALWVAFPPLGMLLTQVSGARELIAVLSCVAAFAAFARGRWILAALASGAAALAGRETVLLPLVLAVADVLERPGDSPRARLRRLAPAFLLNWGAAAWVARVAPGPAPAHAGAAVLWEWARAWAPEGILAGWGVLTHEAPWLVLVVIVLAVGLVPGASKRKDSERSPLLGLGLAAALLPLLPLALAPEPPRAERFAVPALGVALTAAALTRATPWIARALVTATALLSLAANAAPTQDKGTPRFTSAASVRARSAALAPVLDALRPWCRELAAVPRTFAVGVPPESLVRLALDPGARVICRDPRVSVRFVAEMTADDAARPFGVLRLDPSGSGFQFELGDARVKARVGEGLLVFARHAPAAACFESALAERPNDRELIYPTVAALASAQRGAEASSRWQQARVAGLAPSADTLAQRLLVGYRGPDPAAVEGEVARRAERVVSDPTSAVAHLDLGRYLLQLGRARSGTLEISVACGIGRRSQDVFWLAQGYDAMGARMEALEAYRASLAGGLDSTEYRTARGRLVELLRELGPAAIGPPPGR